MNCERAIAEILESLDEDQDTVQGFMRLDAKCAEQLSALSNNCSSELVTTAKGLLENARDDDNEYKLHVVLRALLRRKQPEALGLISEALASQGTMDKETYVTYLQEFNGDARAIAALAQFVAAGYSTEDDPEGWALSKAIDSLRYNKVRRSAAAVLQRLGDEASRVRRAAADFLIALDVEESGAIFEQKLEHENEPEVVEGLVNGLMKWERVSALPELERILKQEFVQENESLRKTLNNAISTFRAKLSSP